MVAPAVVPIVPGQIPNAPQILDDTPAKGPKIGLPDKYDGTKGPKAEVYVTQIGLYVLSNPRMFPDDCSKVIFLISYLTGQASEWAQPFTTKLFAGQPVLYLDFATAFQMMYYDTKRKYRAEKALRQLKQTKSVAHYTF
ncbi:hypothetical protein PtA15_9A186 [Puccinia triticina]|uniref:DUF4939 domain-containing protein n=1 Tax=Puccinia triticina TaxID=208348 RepID=A0ABY7CVE3_9BASI|nr:uncharacterized protein PtA15_9A186 [Puccinia triticina]WAQ88061.1 hypothetical protein PtA15_9A186 [Puccinia triticina]